jgi:hypothetical protein
MVLMIQVLNRQVQRRVFKLHMRIIIVIIFFVKLFNLNLRLRMRQLRFNKVQPSLSLR